MEQNPRQFALLPKTDDTRDISHHRVFGTIAKAQLTTEDFLVTDPLEIKNQDINYPSDYCTAYGATVLAEAEDGVPEVPEYTFMKALQIKIMALGPNPTASQIASIINGFGLELRDIMMAGVKYGFLERDNDPFHCDTSDRPERSFLADYRNWPEDLDMLAWEHAKNSFMSVDGPYDLFDNFRAFLLAHRDNRWDILTGAMWRPSWSKALGGVVYDGSYNTQEQGSGHAFAIIGQAMTEKGLCLVAQMSDGPQFGDHGLYYFDRATANREFTFGAYHFSNVPKATAQIHSDFNFTLDATAWKKFWKVAAYFIKNYITHK